MIKPTAVLLMCMPLLSCHLNKNSALHGTINHKQGIGDLMAEDNGRGEDIVRQAVKIEIYDHSRMTKGRINGLLVDNHKILVIAHPFLSLKNHSEDLKTIAGLDFISYTDYKASLQILSTIDADRMMRDIIVYDLQGVELTRVEGIVFQDFLNGFDDRISFDLPFPTRSIYGRSLAANQNVALLSFSYDFSNNLTIRPLPFHADLPNEGSWAYTISYRTIDGKDTPYAMKFNVSKDSFGLGSTGITKDALIRFNAARDHVRFTDLEMGSPLIVTRGDGRISINGFFVGKIYNNFNRASESLDVDVMSVFSDKETIKMFDRNQLAIDKTISCL